MPRLGKSAQPLSRIVAWLIVLNALYTSICKMEELMSATRAVGSAHSEGDVGHCVLYADTHLYRGAEVPGPRQHLLKRHFGDKPTQDFAHGEWPNAVVLLP